MESILEKLLADNNSIQEETKELREAFEDPGVISSLCNVLVSSSNPQVRQNAAVLLRKRLSKSHHWTRLSAEAKAGIKEGLIQVYVKEQEKVAKNAIVQLIGTIMKLESGKLGWPEMMECLKMWVNSSVLEEKMLGLFALSILAEVVPDVFMEQYPVALYFSQMLVQTLRMPDISASPLAHLTLVCLAHFAPPVQHDQIAALYTESIPTMLALIGDLAKNLRGNSALEAMQVIDKLLENNPAVLQPHLRLLVNFCLDIAFTRLPSITDEMRNKVFNTLSEVVRVKKRVIVCDDLVSPILRVVFELIGKIPAGSGDGGEEEKQEEYFVEYEDDSTPTTCAIQLLDTMALHLPPDKLLPLLMECVEPSVTSADPCARKAAYLSMAMVSERCADYVRTKHLEQFLRYVRQGITEQNTPVRNAALFALGQFSEHLQFYINMTESSTDKGHKVIDQLKSMSGIPNLSLFLLEARTYEELHNYIFCEESHRIQLLKILFAQVDDKLESMLNSTSKRESEILDTLQNLCVSCGFTNQENSRPFIIGKMSLENQCSIWEMIIEGIKLIMNYENFSNELENDIMKVNMFFKNPLLNEFLSFLPRETGQEQQPNHCDSATLDCHIQNTKLKLEHYKDLKLSSTEDEQSALEYNVPSLLQMQQNLQDCIQKWEIGFQSNLESNLNNTSPDKAAIELSSKQNDVRISQNIKTLRSSCSRIEKNLENQKVVTELADRVTRS